VSHGMPAAGVLTGLFVAHPKPAVGVVSLRASSCELRGLEERPTQGEGRFPDAQSVRYQRWSSKLGLDIYLVGSRSSQRTAGRRLSER
jgi:hypothetical protein